MLHGFKQVLPFNYVKKMSSDSSKNVINKMFTNHIYLIYITYSGWYAIKPNPTKSYISNIYV